MTRIRQVESNFTAGEVSPDLMGRGDLIAYENGAEKIRNMFIYPTGGLTRRAGLEYIDTASGNGRLIPFEFNSEQKYLLILTDAQIDIYYEDVKVETLVSPWVESDIKQVAWTQSADTLLLTHSDYTQHIIPTKRDQWASDRFTIMRDKELRDPSVLACGITGNYTGSRADIIIYDDVEVPNTSNTVTKREALRERLEESNFILVPGGMQLYIGTPHTYFSIYAEEPRQEIGEDKTFLDGYKRFEAPVLNIQGNSAWPEQFSQKTIDKIKKQSGPNKFAAQMLLKPVNVSEGRLNVELLKFYNSEIDYLESGRRVYLEINRKKIVSCSAWWDPAFGNIHGDSSVVAIIFSDEEGNYYLHDLSYMQINASEGEDEATLQCRAVSKLIKKHHVPSICVETNGLGKFLPAILRREISALNIPCSVVEKNSAQSKSERIVEAFDAVMAAQALYVHDRVKDTPFVLEMTEWQPNKKYMQDDGLDATAGALLSEPIRIQRSVVTNQRRWLSGSQTFSAETNFKV